MTLEIKHMKENNKLCMVISAVIQLFIILATVLYKEGRDFSTTTMIIIEIICAIISVAGYIYLKDREECHYPILISLAVDYMLILLGSFHTTYMWVFGTLIGITVIIYSNKKICAIACVTATIENIIFMVVYYSAGYAANATAKYMVPTNFAFLILFATICYTVVNTNSRQVAETMADIEEKSVEANKQAEIIKNTSEQVAIKLEEADVAMTELSEKVHSSSDAVEQISTSITMTAEAIQTQTEMSGNISRSLENISEESTTMEQLAAVVKNNVSEGNKIITSLKQQAEITANINNETSKMTAELADSAATVKDIVSAILSISNQTNLLALNASIEAARAGEAGKGFAVVADEIRKLSEDTKSSAEMIADTISTLILSVDTASKNMNKSVESSNIQGQMIGETGSKFDDIMKSVVELAQNVERISENVQECAKATAKVTDAISDLSAMSEQVAASSESSLKLSSDCVNDMDATNTILGDILELSRH